MKRLGFPVLVLVLGVCAGLLLLVLGGRSVGQSSDGWRQLSLPDFVQQIEQLTSGTDPISADLWAEIRSQSGERLLGAVASGTPADYGDLVALYFWSRPDLSAEQDATVLAALVPAANQTSGWPFDKLRSVHDRMVTSQMPATSIAALTLGWLEGRDVRTLTDAGQLAWLLERMQMIDRTAGATRAFSVRWNGLVRAPADGQYTYSLCPVNLDFDNGRQSRRQTAVLWLGGQKVLDTSAVPGVFAAEPVTLTAGQATPIRLDFSYACSDDEVFSTHPAVALLAWTGPGIRQQPVPPEALTTTADTQQGLEATYVLTVGENTDTVTRIDGQIKFIWHHGSSITSDHQALRAALAGQLFEVATSATTLAQWENDRTAQQSSWPGACQAFLQSLDVPSRSVWAQTLLAHPVLLADGSLAALRRLYRECRLGDVGPAVQLFGSWAQAHADEGPKLAVDFYETNRQGYRALAGMMTWHYPPHLEAVEQHYLELADGQCSLPAAYTLAYGYWAEGRIGSWIDKLEARLDDDQLAGDCRVGWLLARAQAEAIRHGRPGRHFQTLEHSLAGLGWIQEACLVAQSEPVRLAAHQQWAARLAGKEQVASARTVLDRAAQRCTSATSTAILAQWRAELNTLEAAFGQRQAVQQAEAREAYIARLTHRWQAALARGDAPAATRYEQLIATAGGSE